MTNSPPLPAFVVQFLLALIALASPIRALGADLPAFPGAEGFGANTPGVRGGKVIFVTNLDDSGPGSFRAACEADGPRLVLFRVAGTIAPNYTAFTVNHDGSLSAIPGSTVTLAVGLSPSQALVSDDGQFLADLSPSPPFEEVVRSQGGHGERVERPNDLAPALARARDAVTRERRQALVNVICPN